MTAFRSTLSDVNSRIERAALEAGRSRDAVRLIAVSKTHPLAAVQEALSAGHRLFGENRVQEAALKYQGLRAAYTDLELHMIGALQTNKAFEAIELFDVIETLDRPSLAEALMRASRKSGRTPQFYIEVNIGCEPQKAGIAPDELSAFLELCQKKCQLNVTGLMCIPPQGQDAAVFFLRLKALADMCGLPHLSMGMSRDFETAIACGATEIRIGSALFGERSR